MSGSGLNLGLNSMCVAAKAGMSNVDVDKVNKIIFETSKNSKYYEHQRKRQEQIAKRIADMKVKIAKITEQEIMTTQNKVDEMAADIEKKRDLSRVVVHIDMDAFYAAVEMRDDPSLNDKPMAVGGMSMLSTSNYPARKFGVRAAMPGFIAKKLCPNLIIVPHNFPKYIAASQQVRKIIGQYDENFSPASLDEAYFDLTEYIATTRSASTVEEAHTVAEEIVFEIRDKIFKETQLTASAGIAPNSRLAKICSDQNKPNGQFRLKPCRKTILEFMAALPIRKVNGIGNVSEQLLNAIGVKTCGDLWERRGLLFILFSQTSFQHFLRISLGIGSSHIHSSEEVQKSISVERTFAVLQDHDAMIRKCEELCHDLCDDMNEHQLQGRTVTLKLKNINFEVSTRSKSLSFHTSDFDAIFRAAKRLLEIEMSSTVPEKIKLRLMGVRMSSLIEEGSQKGTKNSTLDRFLGNENVVKDPIDTSTSGDTPQEMLCPVCGVTQKLDSHEDLNNHVDLCLNKNAIREILAVERAGTSPQSKRPVTEPSSNKRKRKCIRPNNGVTLDRFFKP